MNKTLMKIAGVMLLIGLFGHQLNAQTAESMSVAEIVSAIETVTAESDISNPNHIEPGQQIVFIRENGTQKTYTVKKDDVLWEIVQTVSSQSASPIVSVQSGQTEIVKNASGAIILTSNVASDSFFSWWILALLAFLTGVVYAGRHFWRHRLQDPITAGEPMGEAIPVGGEDEYNAAQRGFTQNYGQTATNVRRCKVSTKGNSLVPVRFADGVVKEMNFNETDALEGMINGEPRYVFRGCTNGMWLQGSTFDAANLVVTYSVNEEEPVWQPEIIAREEAPEAEEVAREILVSMMEDNPYHLLAHPAFSGLSDEVRAVVLADIINASEIPNGFRLVVFAGNKPLSLPPVSVNGQRQSILAEE